MLSKKPSKRLSAKQALKHEWFAGQSFSAAEIVAGRITDAVDGQLQQLVDTLPVSRSDALSEAELYSALQKDEELPPEPQYDTPRTIAWWQAKAVCFQPDASLCAQAPVLWCQPDVFLCWGPLPTRAHNSRTSALIARHLVQRRQDNQSPLSKLFQGGGARKLRGARGAGGFATQRAMGFTPDADPKSKKSSSDESNSDGEGPEPTRARPGLLSILSKD
jgi:hypothetical protein